MSEPSVTETTMALGAVDLERWLRTRPKYPPRQECVWTLEFVSDRVSAVPDAEAVRDAPILFGNERDTLYTMSIG